MKKSGWLCFIVFLITSCPLLDSCVKDPYQDQLKQEENQLADYVSKNNITEKPRPSGLYFITQDTGIGNSPLTTDYVLINYSATYLDGTLYDTTDSTEFKNLDGHIPWFKPGGPLIMSMSSAIFPGMMEGLSLLREGGNATLLMTSSLAGNSFNPVPRIFHVQLLKVYDSIAYTQNQLFNSLMVKKGFVLGDSATTAYIDTSNVKGEGHYRLPTDKDTVVVKYTIKKFMDDMANPNILKLCEVVDSFKFAMDTVPKPIFYDVLKIMTTTGTAKIYFTNGSGSLYDNKTGQLEVPPFSNVCYEVELVGFANNKKRITDKTQ